MANVPTTRTTKRKPAQKAKAAEAAKASVNRSNRAAINRTRDRNAAKLAATSKPATRKPRTTAKKPATRKPTTAKKRSTRKPVSAIRGGGAALPDFGNADRITVIAKKRAEISRADCFKSGDTVSKCLLKQKEAGHRGRRKYIRTQKAAGRISLRKA